LERNASTYSLKIFASPVICAYSPAKALAKASLATLVSLSSTLDAGSYFATLSTNSSRTCILVVKIQQKPQNPV